MCPAEAVCGCRFRVTAPSLPGAALGHPGPTAPVLAVEVEREEIVVVGTDLAGTGPSRSLLPDSGPRHRVSSQPQPS